MGVGCILEGNDISTSMSLSMSLLITFEDFHRNRFFLSFFFFLYDGQKLKKDMEQIFL